uniref:DDHD domain-containing protein n=1 Tax=Oryza glumipatula TaxID=40148 RepID=A0A0E0AIL2_9ORYZ
MDLPALAPPTIAQIEELERWGHAAVVSVLLNHGADADANVNGAGFNGATPLLLACSHTGSIRFVNCLVESGADPNIPDEVKHFLPSRRQLQLLKGYFSTGVNKMWILAIGRVLDVTVTPREIEPLVCEYYISKCPVIVPYHRGGKRIHVGVQELTISLKILLHGLKLLLASSKDVDSNNEKEKSYGYMMMERLTGSPDGRIDHVLQVYSCSNYWRDHDTAFFILKHLYRDIPEETPTDDPERMPIRLFYATGIVEAVEDLLRC